MSRGKKLRKLASWPHLSALRRRGACRCAAAAEPEAGRRPRRCERVVAPRGDGARGPCRLRAPTDRYRPYPSDSLDAAISTARLRRPLRLLIRSHVSALRAKRIYARKWASALSASSYRYRYRLPALYRSGVSLA